MRNTADVTGGKPIAVLLLSISGVSAINPLVAFYDIHGGKREKLFFYFVPDTTRDQRHKIKITLAIYFNRHVNEVINKWIGSETTHEITDYSNFKTEVDKSVFKTDECKMLCFFVL
jgi:hypothetical protein